MNEETLINIRKLRPFTRFIYTIGELPTSYLMSMTYEEQLIWLCNYIEKTVIPTINNNGQAVEELQNLYVELKNYVDNYFDNLDVQEEINNKLDEMAESGQLAEIIAQYLQLNVVYSFDTVNELSQAENLIDGSFAETIGFNTVGDGGGSKYYIREVTNTDVVDGYTKIALTNTQNLIAILVIPDILNVHQFGIFGDGETDVTEKLQKAFSYNLYIPTGTYIVSDKIDVYNHLVYGDGREQTIIKLADNSSFVSDGILKTSVGVDDFTIKNLSYDGNKNNNSEYKTFLILYNSNNIYCENIGVYNSKGGGIKLNDSTNVRITNCDFKNLDGTAGSTSPAIYGNPVNNLTIDNCYCEDIADHFLYLTSDNENKYSKNVIVKNCILKGSGKDALTAGSALCIYSNSQDVIIDNCILKSNRSGIYVGEHGEYTFTPKNITISNCLIDETILSAISFNGTSTDSVKNVKVSNCVIKNITEDGITTSRADNITIDNCEIHHTRAGISAGYGDIFDIYNCKVYDNTTGILIGKSAQPTNKVHIYNSLIFGIEGQVTGLYLNVGDNIKVYQCDIFSNTTNISQNATTNVSYLNMTDRGSSNFVIPNITFSNRVPQTGTYKTGDIVLFIGSETYVGAICTEGGTPGTWRLFN